MCWLGVLESQGMGMVVAGDLLDVTGFFSLDFDLKAGRSYQIKTAKVSLVVIFCF